MTDVGYAVPDVGKRGPKPTRGEAKLPYATRLPVEHIDFLRTLDNAAGWIEQRIDEHEAYRAFIKRAKKRGRTP